MNYQLRMLKNSFEVLAYKETIYVMSNLDFKTINNRLIMAKSEFNIKDYKLIL